MIEGDWGVDSPELRVPATRSAPWEPVESDDCDDVPAVKEARALGYEAAPDAPLWCYLPFVWPTALRSWVRDNRVRRAILQSSDGSPPRHVHWTTADYAEMEAETNGSLAAGGVPPRPPGRIWLLKPPPGASSVDAVLARVMAAAAKVGLDASLAPAFVEHTRAGIAEIFPSR